MRPTQFPYEVLAERGISPSSPAQVIREFIPTERCESEAWQLLRETRSRLKTDFFLYQAHDEERLIRLQRRLHADDNSPSTALFAELAQDAPILMLLSGDREQARHSLERLQLSYPEDAANAHRLALLSYAEAQKSFHAGEQQQSLIGWEQCIAYWVYTLFAHGYWTEWCHRRREDYEETSQATLRIGFEAAVRKDLCQYLWDELREIADHCEREGDLEQVENYVRLLGQYETEIAAAQALDAAGGIMMDETRRIVCGPLFLRKFDLWPMLKRLLFDLHEEVNQYEQLPATQALAQQLEPRVSSVVTKQMRIYFSGLAQVASCLKLNRPQAAITKLEETHRREPFLIDDLYTGLRGATELFRRDLAELAIDAHVAIARQQLAATSANVKVVAVRWRRILKEASEAGLRDYAKQIISDLAIERVRTLETNSAATQLDDAIAILEEAASLLAEAFPDQLLTELVSHLRRRGRQNEIADQYEWAVDDLRRAFDLQPDDLSVRDQYCIYLVHDALNKHAAGQTREARTIIERAKRLIENGLQSCPDDEELKSTLDWINEQMYALKTDDSQSEDAWANLSRALQSLQESEPVKVLRGVIKEAEVKRENKEFVSAAQLIEEVLQRDPLYGRARIAAAENYVDWGLELLEAGELEQAREKARLAADYQFRSARLDELRRRLDRMKGFL
jgi:tetratricopeptide (TPR) repeat protein